MLGARRLAAPAWPWAGLGALLLVALLALGACSRGEPGARFITEGRPEKLSDWGVLAAEGGRLRPAAGVLPYELNTALFSDHAHKLRTVWMPAGSAARYDEREAFDFPVGTILSKTFYYPRGGPAGPLRQLADDGTSRTGGQLDLGQVRLIETRLLVRREAGWIALPYVWNAEQTEATLARTGESLRLELVDGDGRARPFTYVVPNENQCASCHVVDLKNKALRPIGPKARHLNREVPADDGPTPQLARWVRAGFLAGLPDTALPRAADWRDGSAPLEARARAYLDINCAHCHSSRAAASNTALALDAFATVDRTMGLCKPPVAAGKGTGDRLFGIVPGQPDASIMAFRLASTEGGVMMPELGRSTVHEDGVALVRQWIASLPGHCRTTD